MSRRYLIMARVGDKSLHSQWIKGSERNFDLFLSYYGKTQDKYKADAEFYHELAGPKWPILQGCIAENREMIERYDAVWFPDDDILADTDTINRMFLLFSGLDLDLAQPALTPESYMSHVFLMQEPNVLARYTNFVEVMVPIISRRVLPKLAATFSQSGTGWGLDYLWPALLDNRNVAVLDSTPVTHTRPIGGDLYKNNPNINQYQDRKQLLEMYAHIGLKRDKPRILRRLTIERSRSPFSQQLGGFMCRVKNKLRYKRVARYQSAV